MVIYLNNVSLNTIMLETIYIVMLLIDVALIIIGLTNCLDLTHNSRRLIMIIALVITIPLMVASYSIEEKYCVYTTEFLCHSEIYQDLTMVIITIMFMLLALTYLILDIIGYLGTAEKQE